MRITKLHMSGLFLMAPEIHSDNRGNFQPLLSSQRLKNAGLESNFVNICEAYNKTRNTFRGLHYQIWPHTQAKIIRCVRGSITDVVVDMRPKSPTYLQHVTVSLSEAYALMLYVGKGFAHGYQTMQDDTVVQYFMSDEYHPEHERGVRWDDPALGIWLPRQVSVISDRDASYPLVTRAQVD